MCHFNINCIQHATVFVAVKQCVLYFYIHFFSVRHTSADPVHCEDRRHSPVVHHAGRGTVFNTSPVYG